jgi:hypothetical protein
MELNRTQEFGAMRVRQWIDVLPTMGCMGLPSNSGTLQRLAIIFVLPPTAPLFHQLLEAWNCARVRSKRARGRRA